MPNIFRMGRPGGLKHKENIEKYGKDFVDYWNNVGRNGMKRDKKKESSMQFRILQEGEERVKESEAELKELKLKKKSMWWI